MTARSPEDFNRTLAWVALVHLLLLCFLLMWTLIKPRTQPAPQFINMLNAGDLVKGRPGPSEGTVVGPRFQPAAPAPPPAAPKPIPQPVKAVETPPTPVPQPQPQPEVTPTAEETPAPKVPDATSWSPDKTKPQPKAVAKSTPSPKAKPKVNVNLTEVSRVEPGNSSSTVAGTEPGATGKAQAGVKGMTAEGVAEKLGKELHASGVDKAVGIGPSGSADGTSGVNGWYYTLIRDQMYENWNMPISLAGKKLETLIRIFVEKSGAITKVELIHSSGNKEHDDSALMAVHRVGRIKQPLPDGMDGNIEINFRITE